MIRTVRIRVNEIERYIKWWRERKKERERERERVREKV